MSGRRAKGPTPDGKGPFQYLADPKPLDGPVLPTPADERLYGTGNPARSDVI